ncbi:sialidase family protein [Cohnella nanjingensis]|uniref:Exo-alpha-sialidase n=1 Tax=Cohnella nanjingensis TaxID=1387779 RepID=A0A7X0VE61_9BACL|nr:sialidase family protein [Cohnella nanjingensis]MBB6670660.1 exo-alpha-sialidase [Cohnella nanjingensis]
MKTLANDLVKIYESSDPSSVYCYSPGIARLPSGRLVATMDLGGPGVQAPYGKIFTSDDRGKSWTHRGDYPFVHARPFVAGRSLYVLGHSGDLMVIRSDDDGESWTEPAALTSGGEQWHQAPCNVHYANGSVYLVMEKRLHGKIEVWAVGELAPVLMRGKTDADLTRAENWTFASELAFCDAVPAETLDYFGVPFFHDDPKRYIDVAPGRGCAAAGWLETNVVQFTDPDHYWHDPSGRTFHLWMRAHTGGSGYAAIAKVVEQDDGSMITMLEHVPSGKQVVFVPCPGGQMKFHMLYDEVTRLYWLLSTQATDSMTRAERLPADRYNLPNNERSRLQLHYSRNCIDWCFAGLVAEGPSARHSRHYASMAIDGEDLHILSRSGDERAYSAHNGNFISFHTVANFRELVY